jgi:hypothetical protein
VEHSYAAMALQEGRAGCEIRPTSLWRTHGVSIARRHLATPTLVDGALVVPLGGSTLTLASSPSLSKEKPAAASKT